MYAIITDIFADILSKRPLINTGSIIAQMRSRADAIDDLYSKMYDNKCLKECTFNAIRLEDLNGAIIETAVFINKMNKRYTSLIYSVDSGSPRRLIDAAFEMGSRGFEGGFQEYLWEANKNLVKVFNEFVSRDGWISFDSLDLKDLNNERPLPLVDRLMINL